MVDILASIEADERAMARIATALEIIAGAFSSWYNLESQRLKKEFPPKHEPRESTFTRIPTAEDRLRAAQGATGESIEEWMQIGPRERELIESTQPKTTPPKK
jgi:hypothetical protein